MSMRHAIYYAPAHSSPWWTFGAGWLGRDESHDGTPPEFAAPMLPAADRHHITTQARRYGFHATLKAPFHLRAGVTPAELLARTRSLAHRLRPVPLSPLQVRRLGPYVVLLTPDHHTAVSDLASACVIELDDLRQPLTPDELARRQPATLDARELELLHRYGYPHVLERYLCHFTLTDPINEAQAAQVTEAVSNQVDQLNAQTPLTLDRLCIFEEPAPGQAFRRRHDLVLGA
jgi:putative phosphonate metabolism protein